MRRKWEQSLSDDKYQYSPKNTSQNSEIYDIDPFKPKNHLNYSNLETNDVFSPKSDKKSPNISQLDFSEQEISENGPHLVSVDGTFLHFSDDPLSSHMSDISSVRKSPADSIKIQDSPLSKTSSSHNYFNNEEKPILSTFTDSYQYPKTPSSSGRSIIPLSPEEVKSPTFTDEQSSIMETDRPIIPDYTSLPSGSPIRLIAPGRSSYNLDNLPSDAFDFGSNNNSSYNRDEEVTPLILSCPLTPRIARKDTESDFEFSYETFEKDDFFNFIGDDISNQLRSRIWKQRVRGLNEIQQMFQSEKDLDDYADLMLYGLKETPGFRDINISVNEVLLDLFRHIIVKSENIKKSTISVIVPYLTDKIADNRLHVPICELILIISEAICPSFVLLEFLSDAWRRRNQKSIAGILDISVEIVKLYGPGDLILDKYIPLLTDSLTSGSSETKKYAIELAVCLSVKYKEAIYEIASKLQKNIKARLLKALDAADEIPPPSRTFYRQREQNQESFSSPKKKKVASQKLSEIITFDQCINAETTTKFSDQKNFLSTVNDALEECKFKIVSNDLEPIIKALKKMVLEGNKNIILLSLQTLNKLAECSDEGISKWSNLVAPCVSSAWCDQRQAIREEATKVAVSYGNPPAFIKMILLMSSLVSQTRLEVLKYIESVEQSLTNDDYKKLSDFVAFSFEDKSSSVRKGASQVAELIIERVPDEFRKSFSRISQQAQKRLQNIFEKKTSSVESEKKSFEEPPEIEQIMATPEHKTPERRFSISPTKPKKDRRIAGFTDFLTTNLTDKEKIVALTEKTKIDAQLSLPPVIFQHLFSNLVSEQNSAFTELNILIRTDKESIYQCSDIFVRFSVISTYLKSPKIANLSLNFLQNLFSEEFQISLQELQMLIPALLWSYDNNTAVIDECDDLLFTFRTTIDSHELSELYITQIPNIGPNGLITVFTELQFTVSDDTKLALDLFSIAVSYIQTDNELLNKACGGLLCAISGILSNTDKDSIIKGLDREKRDALLKILPFDNAKVVFSFVGFSNLTTKKKLEALKRVNEIAKESSGKIEFSISEILDEFIHEKIDWSLIKSLLFSIYQIVCFCSVEKDDIEKLFSIVCFFSNRRQKQILLVNGGAQLIDAVIFQFIKRLDALSIFKVIYEGMTSFTISLSPDCFYCKLWVTVLMQIDSITKGNADICKEIVEFAYSKLDESRDSPLLQRLLSAVITKVSENNNEEEEEYSSEEEIKELPKQMQYFTPKKKVSPTKIVSPLLESVRYISPKKRPNGESASPLSSIFVPENISFSEPKKRRKSKIPAPSKFGENTLTEVKKKTKQEKKKKPKTKKKPIKFVTQTFSQVDVEPTLSNSASSKIIDFDEDSSMIEGSEDIFKSPQRNTTKVSHFSPKNTYSHKKSNDVYNKSQPIRFQDYDDFIESDSKSDLESDIREPAILQPHKRFSPVFEEDSDDELPIFNKNLNKITPKKKRERSPIQEDVREEERHGIIEIPEEYFPKPEPISKQSNEESSFAFEQQQEDYNSYNTEKPLRKQKMNFVENISPMKEMNQNEEVCSPAQRVARSKLSFLPSQNTSSSDESDDDDFFPAPVNNLLPVSPNRNRSTPRISKSIASLWKTH